MKILVYKECEEKINEDIKNIGVVLPDEVSSIVLSRSNDRYEFVCIVEDYIRMCDRTKEKIRLDICTRDHIQKLHDKISESKYQNSTGPVKVPKTIMEPFPLASEFIVAWPPKVSVAPLSTVSLPLGRIVIFLQTNI